MNDEINSKGFTIINDLFTISEMEDAENNILNFANIFRRKIKSKSQICRKNINKINDLNKFLIWLDNYNSKYLFSFVGLVSQLPTVKKLTINESIIDLSCELLKSPKNELLSGESSFLVNTPSSERLIYQWHNAKNNYPKREVHINYWVPLIKNKTKNNGTLLVASKSHLSDYLFLQFKSPSDNSGKSMLTQNLIPDHFVNQFNIIPLEVDVGSCAAMLPKTIHSGSFNQTSQCSYVLVFKIWANHKDWTLSSKLDIKYFSGDIGSGADVQII